MFLRLRSVFFFNKARFYFQNPSDWFFISFWKKKHEIVFLEITHIKEYTSCTWRTVTAFLTSNNLSSIRKGAYPASLPFVTIEWSAESRAFRLASPHKSLVMSKVFGFSNYTTHRWLMIILSSEGWFEVVRVSMSHLWRSINYNW